MTKTAERTAYNFTARFRKLTGQLRYLPRVAGMVWAASGRWTTIWAALLGVQALLPVALVYLTRAVVNELVRVMNRQHGWRVLGWLLGAMAAVMLLSEILRGVTRWVRVIQAELVQYYISTLVQSQALRLDLAFYETPEYYDLLYRAHADAQSRPLALLEDVGSLAQNGLTLIAMAGVLLPYGVLLPLALLASALPALYVVLANARREHNWRQARTTLERRANHYSWFLTLREAAAEIRLFALGEHFQTQFQELRGELREGHQELLKRQTYAELAASGAGLLVLGAACGWMLWRAVQGWLTLGDLALFYQAFNQGQTLLQSLFASVGRLYTNILFLENLFDFLALAPRVHEPAQPVPVPARFSTGIRLQNVTFRYPGSTRPALENFDFTLPAGRIVAVVGVNGAGKSTLIKLLCRFYDPDEGRVTLDGIDLRDFSLDDLRRAITVLFQEPVRYYETAADNIAYGEVATRPDTEKIVAAAKAAGADEPLRKLPQGYATLLGKAFGGAELSGGEWQRVALARAFLRQASLIILDEPTSAMDSWAEADWLARFRALVNGRTALIITHRFTTAMQADIIHVMEAGHVVESGTHEELLAGNGRYAASWRAQMRDTDVLGVPPLGDCC